MTKDDHRVVIQFFWRWRKNRIFNTK